MIYGVSSVEDGAPGIQAIVNQLAQLKDHFGRLPQIRAAAAQIIRGSGNHDQAAHINAIAGFVRHALVYVADPLDAEFIQTPDVLLLQIHARGFAQGDCDDHCLLFASLCQSIGIRCEIVGVASTGSGLADHVITIAHLDDGTLQFDLVAKGSMQPSHDVSTAVFSQV